MHRWRPVLALVLAAAVGTAAGLMLANVTKRRPTGTVIGLGQVEVLGSPAGSISVAFPAGWIAGRTGVNCDNTRDLHVSTEDVDLNSFAQTVGTGRTCSPELDPRPLSRAGAYVTVAFFQLPETTCASTGLPTEAPASLEAVPVTAPPVERLQEFGAAGAYDAYEWRTLDWCVPGGAAIRLEVFLGVDASASVRDQADRIVQALTFTPT